MSWSCDREEKRNDPVLETKEVSPTIVRSIAQRLDHDPPVGASENTRETPLSLLIWGRTVAVAARARRPVGDQHAVWAQQAARHAAGERGGRHTGPIAGVVPARRDRLWPARPVPLAVTVAGRVAIALAAQCVVSGAQPGQRAVKTTAYVLL